jgi:hypothetical protein
VNRILVVSLLAVLSASTATAQPSSQAEQPGRVYLGAAIVQSRAPGETGESTQTYSAAPGGPSWGWSITGGVFLQRHFSIEAELSRTGLMTATEHSRYNITYFPTRRDTTVTFAGRVHLRPGRAVDIEPLAGFLVGTMSRGMTSTTTTSYSPPSNDTFDIPSLRISGLSLGVDLRLGNRRVAIVPSFRLRQTHVNLGDDTWWPGNSGGGWTIAAGLGVRASF